MDVDCDQEELKILLSISKIFVSMELTLTELRNTRRRAGLGGWKISLVLGVLISRAIRHKS